MWTAVVVPLSAGTSHTAPWPEDALTGSVLRPRLFRLSWRSGTSWRGGSPCRWRRRTIAKIATHYDTLGVGPDATGEEIRAAYLAGARRSHPDVTVGDHPASEPSMADLNRAYDVLSRPRSRREYDHSLRSAGRATTSRADDDVLVDLDGDEAVDAASRPPDTTTVITSEGPARMPWKLMAIAAVIGSIAVIASAALTGERRDDPPDGILRIGSCVEVLATVEVREISCAEDDSLVVRLVLPTGSRCPSAYLGYRDRLGLGTACVEAVE